MSSRPSGTPGLLRESISQKIKKLLIALHEGLAQVWQYNMGKVGLVLFFIIIAVSIAAAVTMPPQFDRKWMNIKYWSDNPQKAPPEWLTLFGAQLAPHKVVEVRKAEVVYIERTPMIALVYSTDYVLDVEDFPQEVIVRVKEVIANLTVLNNITVAIGLNLTRPDGFEATIFRKSVAIPQLEAQDIRADPALSIEAIEDIAPKAYGIKREVLAKYREEIVKGARYIQALFGIVSIENGKLEIKPLKGRYILRFYVYLPNPDILERRLKSIEDVKTRKFYRDLIKDVRRILDEGLAKHVKIVVRGRRYGLLGTDLWGRDIALGVFYGFPAALLIGFFAAVTATLAGAIIGVISGYYGGLIDEIIQRIIDVMANIPLLPILVLVGILVQELLENPWHRLLTIVGVIIAFSWGGVAIIVRSMTLSIKAEPYIEAARAVGASNRRIIFRHVFPQIIPYTFAVLVFSVPSAILTEAGLSVLGISHGLPTWGRILADARANMSVALEAWWWILPPGIMLAVTSFTFVALGMTLETIVEPRLRRT